MNKKLSSTMILGRDMGPGFIPRYSTYSYNQDYDLAVLLFEYYEKLGVDCYEKYDDEPVQWRLKNRWYSSGQIDRMLRLSAFS